MENYSTDYISVINSILMLIDFQANKVEEVGSSDKADLVGAAKSSVRAARYLNVPVIITGRPENGTDIDEITGIFPGKETIKRTTSENNVLEDDTIKRLLRRYGRSKLILAGIHTSQSILDTAIHAIKAGYDVFVMIDGCGDLTYDKHNYGVNRLLKAGVTPITWMSLASEWMNGWVDPVENEYSDEVFGKYNMMLSYLARH